MAKKPKNKPTEKTIFSVYISVTHRERLVEICKRENRTQSNVLEMMIDHYDKKGQ
jgi:hypothetical protein